MTYTQKTMGNLRRLAALSDKRNGITPEMYTEHTVFRGLRDMAGNGVVTGLTEISTIKAKEKAPDGTVHTCPGELFYRGYNICDLPLKTVSVLRKLPICCFFPSCRTKRSCTVLKKCWQNSAVCRNPLYGT